MPDLTLPVALACLVAPEPESPPEDVETVTVLERVARSEAASAREGPCSGAWIAEAHDVTFDLLFVRSAGTTAIVGVLFFPGEGRIDEIRGTCDGDSLQFTRFAGTLQTFTGTADGDHWSGRYSEGGRSYAWRTRALK